MGLNTLLKHYFSCYFHAKQIMYFQALTIHCCSILEFGRNLICIAEHQLIFYNIVKFLIVYIRNVFTKVKCHKKSNSS